MLTKEYAHISEQNNNTKLSIDSMFKGLHTSFPALVNKKSRTSTEQNNSGIVNRR